MLRILSVLIIPFFVHGSYFAQESSEATVNRVFVKSHESSVIIYEYARAFFIEEKAVNRKGIECFISEMKNTGLFTDVNVQLKDIENENKVNVFIKPTWSLEKDSLIVEEIVFQNFEGIDEHKLRQILGRKGLKTGLPLLRRDFPHIKTKIRQAVRRIYESEVDLHKDFELRTSDLSTRIKLIVGTKVRLTVIAGQKEICESDPTDLGMLFP